MEPCLARTSHSPLVNVTSSLIAHLKSPIKTDDYRYRRTFFGQRSATAAAAAVTLCVAIIFRPTVAARVQQGCDFIQMAETRFRLIYPNEGELVFCRLNKWIEYIVNLKKKKTRSRPSGNQQRGQVHHRPEIPLKYRIVTLIQTSVVSS